MSVTQRLLDWFDAHRRELPWRREPRDPYRVWLAEIMLQQTQVATVIPYFERWLERFPTLRALAEAPLDDVLKRWEGLGYYSRARNLHRAARQVVFESGGVIPDTASGLRELPGIGPYTAGAIASLAFNRDEPLVDGNVKRVLGRLFAGDDRTATVAGLWALAEALLPPGRAGAFNEALMDLGATVCAPAAPRCMMCPVRDACAAFGAGDPEAFPPKRARPGVPHRHVGTAIITDSAGRLLLAQRERRGLLGGLWEFPSTDFSEGLDASAGMAPHIERALRESFGLDVRLAETDIAGVERHAFTHFRITRHVARAGVGAAGDVTPRAARYRAAGWFARDELDALALARSDRRILRAFLGDTAA